MFSVGGKTFLKFSNAVKMFNILTFLSAKIYVIACDRASVWRGGHIFNIIMCFNTLHSVLLRVFNCRLLLS